MVKAQDTRTWLAQLPARSFIGSAEAHTLITHHDLRVLLKSAFANNIYFMGQTLNSKH